MYLLKVVLIFNCCFEWFVQNMTLKEELAKRWGHASLAIAAQKNNSVSSSGFSSMEFYDWRHLLAQECGAVMNGWEHSKSKYLYTPVKMLEPEEEKESIQDEKLFGVVQLRFKANHNSPRYSRYSQVICNWTLRVSSIDYWGRSLGISLGSNNKNSK